MHTIPGAAPVVKDLVKEFMAQPGSSSIRMSSRLKSLHKQQRKKAFASSAERKRKRKFVKKQNKKIYRLPLHPYLFRSQRVNAVF